LSSEGERAYR